MQVLRAADWFPACIPLQMLKGEHKACNTRHVTIYRGGFSCAFDIAKDKFYFYIYNRPTYKLNN